MSEIEVRMEERDDVVVAVLEGELDLASAGEVERQLLAAEAARPRHLVVDLRELRFIDSTGLRLILSADARARRDERRLTIVRGPEPVDRVFKIALLDRRLEFIDDPSTIGTEEPTA